MPENLKSYHAFCQNTSFAEEIEDIFFAKGVIHYASHLLERGLDVQTVESAVRKAITVCIVSGLPVDRHFKNIFICAHEITKDWLVSSLALQLILLNADVSNPLVARLQVEIVAKLFIPFTEN